MQGTLEIFPQEQSQNDPTSLRSDFLAKTFQLLASEKVYLVHEVVCFLRRLGLSKYSDPKFLSLKTSKVFYQATQEKTLSSYCEQLPTLGYMSANGNCLILDGYYPKIENGFSLSDILQEEVSQEYFLSQTAISSLMKIKDKGLGYSAERSIVTITKEQMEKEQ